MSDIKSQYLLLSSLKKNPNEFSLVKDKSMFKFQANLYKVHISEQIISF